jgi:hypothetical protein
VGLKVGDVASGLVFPLPPHQTARIDDRGTVVFLQLGPDAGAVVYCVWRTSRETRLVPSGAEKLMKKGASSPTP